MKKIKSNSSPFLWLVLFFTLTIFTGFHQFSIKSIENSSSKNKVNQSLSNWTYIEVDNSRAKWGDWDKPDWLRYFGLDMKDVTGNGYKDIVAGRYFYRNPGGNMTAKWERIDLGMNVDGMLFVDVDGDELGDIIATALPGVYWFEAQDKQGSSWKGIKIGEVPATTHVNGQGYATAQIVPGGKEEILLATGEGIYYFAIPDKNPEKGNWPVIHAAPEASDEGFGIGDIDGDGLLDIVAGLRQGEEEGSGMEVLWWKNPGNRKGNWKSYSLGSTKFDADRIVVADINGNGKNDVVVTEERWPGKEPDASLYWFEQPDNPTQKNWKKHRVVTQYSMNNLDVADMDGDGHNDIITAEHKGSDLEVQIWKNDGNGKFTKTIVDKGKESHLGSRVADLNGNGALDIVSIGWDQYEYLHIWRNDNQVRGVAGERIKWKHYSSAKGDFPAPGVGNQSALLIFDIDNDGTDEIVVAGWGDTSMVWYKKTGDSWAKYLLDNNNSHIEAGGTVYDIDGDGDLDILHGGSWATNEIWWWENPYPDYDSQKLWERHTIKDFGEKQHHDQIFGDFDGDGKAELVFWNQRAGKLFIADIPEKPKDKNAWKFNEIWSWGDELKYEGLAKADIDLDGKENIVGGGYWFKNTSGKNFEAHKIDDYGSSRSAVGDLIKGGRPEIILGSGDDIGPLNMYQWKNDKWEKTVLIGTVVHGHSLQILDVDGDGNLDIFTGEMVLWHNGSNPGAKTWILYGDGKGNFKKEIINAAIDIGDHESKLGDVDGDGRPDIIQKPFMKDIPRLDIWLNQGIQYSNTVKKNNSDSYSFKVDHVVQGYLGPNHLANLVYRKGSDGDKFVGWGRYPLTEWEVGSASKKQVVPTGDNQRYSNGGCAMDITGDGIDEIITARGEMSNLANSTLLWFKEVEGKDYWEEHKIASIWSGGNTSPHDIVPYIKKTASGKEFKAVLANKGRKEMHMFVVPENLQDEWPHYVIGNFPVNAQSGLQLADINGDGNIDIISGNFWIEAPDGPTDVPWKFHRFCEWDEMGEKSFGGMNYHAVADFTGDGFQDMIVVEAEIPDSRISLFVRSSDDGKGLWKEIPLDGDIDVPHSLVAIDLNNDTRMDFIIGEMTAGGWNFPLNPNPKLYAYINKGEANFEKITLYEGWGMHEMKLFPKPFEGKIMVYAADEIQPHKFDNMNTHVSYWLISKE